jgi:hypothetical protein
MKFREDLDFYLKVEKPKNFSEKSKNHLKNNKLGQLNYKHKLDFKKTSVRPFFYFNKINLLIILKQKRTGGTH